MTVSINFRMSACIVTIAMQLTMSSIRATKRTTHYRSCLLSHDYMELYDGVKLQNMKNTIYDESKKFYRKKGIYRSITKQYYRKKWICRSITKDGRLSQILIYKRSKELDNLRKIWKVVLSPPQLTMMRLKATWFDLNRNCAVTR